MARSSKDIQFSELKDMISQLNMTIKTLNDTIARQVTVNTLSDEERICPLCGSGLLPTGTEVIRYGAFTWKAYEELADQLYG